MVQLSHLYMAAWKTILLTIWTFAVKVMSLIFNMLSRFVKAFLPKSKCFFVCLFVCFYFMTAVTICSDFGAQENKVCHYFQFFPICHEVTGLDAIIFLWMLSFKPAFSLSCFTFIKRLFSSSSLSAIRVMSSGYLTLLIFILEILIPALASSSLAFCMIYSA